MANASAIQNVIDLKSELITSKNKNTITPFIGFKKRNSPYLNDSLKALTENKNVEASIFDNEGNAYVWREETGEFLINGEVKGVVDKQHPVEEDITPVYLANDPSILNYWYAGNDSWVYLKVLYLPTSSQFYVHLKKENHDRIIGEFEFEDFLTSAFSIYGNVCCLFVNDHFWCWKISDDTSISEALVTFETDIKRSVSIENGETIINEKSYYYFFMRNNEGNDNPCGIIVDPVTGEIVCRIYDTSVKGIFYAYEGKIFYFTLKSETESIYEFAVEITFILEGNDVVYSYEFITTGINTGAINQFKELEKTTYKTLYVHGFFLKVEFSSGRAVVPNKREIQHFTGDKVDNFLNPPTDGFFLDKDTVPVVNTILPFEKTDNGYFCLLINGGEASGISYVSDPDEGIGTLCSEWLSIVSDNFKPYFLVENGVNTLIFEDKNRKIKKLSIVEDVLKVQILDNKYVLFSSVDAANCYDIEKKKFIHWASDWNNRFKLSRYTGSIPSTMTYQNIEVAGGVVDYVNLKNPIVTAIFNPFFVRVINVEGEDLPPEQFRVTPDYNGEVDIYVGENTVPEYYISYNYNSYLNKYVNHRLLNTLYPVATDGNLILNPSVQMKLTKTNYQMNYLKDSEDIYSLVYNNGHSILAYGYGTQLSELSTLFILQGQAYIIRNNIINSVVIENNLLQNITPVISCNGLDFLGASLSYAYFWSKADKHIYIFSGNREFSKTSDMSEINEIINSAYNINTGSFFLIANNKVYVSVNDEYIYTINGKYKDIKFFDKGFALEIDTNNWDVFSYYGGSNRPVELETAFYGAGSNKLSVIDCWYLRLYSDEPKAGNVTCSIVTLTNKGEVTDSYTFHLTAELWDKETNTYYLRYQPKNQRSVGTTLRVKSDFDIIDLQCSVFPDNAVQISNPVVKTYQSGAKI